MPPDLRRHSCWGFAAIVLAAGLVQPAGNDNGDLEEEGHNVTWQQVRNIEPPIADEDSFAVDVGWRQPLRLPTSARSEDGRTFSPALLKRGRPGAILPN